MTREEKAIEQLKFMLEQLPVEPPSECDYVDEWFDADKKTRSALKAAIDALDKCNKIEEILSDWHDVPWGTSRDALHVTLLRIDDVIVKDKE